MTIQINNTRLKEKEWEESQSLYYTIENIIGELTEIIINNSNLPPVIIDFYEDINNLFDGLDSIMPTYGLNAVEAKEQISDIFNTMFDLYMDHLELEFKNNYERSLREIC